MTNKNAWIEKCQHWKKKWPIIQDSYLPDPNDTKLNIYAVINFINQYSKPEHIIMADGGSMGYVGPTAIEKKHGQRLILNLAQGEMGWALPASIGVAIASDRPIIVVIGDGSFMLNIQELATIRHHNLNIKFFIMNNSGYLSIKNTQNKYFEGRVYGTDVSSGLWFPDFSKIANAFDMEYCKINTKQSLENIQLLLEKKNPIIIDCECLSEQEIMPSQAVKNGKQAGLHDMYPFLTNEDMTKELLDKRLSNI